MSREDLAVISSVFPLALLVVLYVWWRIAGSDRQKAKQQSSGFQHREFSSASKTARPKASQVSELAFSGGTMQSHYAGGLALGGAQMMSDALVRARMGTSDRKNMPDHEQWDDIDSPSVGTDPLSVVGPLSLFDSDEHHHLHAHEDPFIHCPDNFGIDPH